MKIGDRISSKKLITPLSVEPLSLPIDLLLVDDNRINLKVISHMMQTIGAHITTASNGREAIERMRDVSFDIVLMDIHMPVLDGIEAIKLIRSGAAGVLDSTMPIIAVSSDTQLQQKQGYLAVGFNDFIEKPVNMFMLHTSIVTALPDRFQGSNQQP